MKLVIKSLLKSVVSFIIRKAPKLEYCLLKGVPSYEDSLVSIYQQLPLDKLTKVIWSCHSLVDLPPFENRGKTTYVKKGSLKELYYGIVSKYIFTSHGHFIPVVPENQRCYNVWHGMPIKGIGLLDNQEGRQDTYLVATSTFYQKIMSESFGMPIERTTITGIPRNDLLVNTDTEEIWKKVGVDRSQYNSVFLWLPTYRKSVLGYIAVDGVEVDNVFNMKSISIEIFEKFLKDKKCLCIIKPHPMAPKKDIPESDNLLVIDESWLWSRCLTLYTLLGEVDFLVSDVSSVIIDFMLLDRPIVVCFEDIEEYSNSRSLTFENTEDWLAGEIALNYSELEEKLDECIQGHDRHRVKRNELKNKFHTYSDFKATQRVIERMGIGEIETLD